MRFFLKALTYIPLPVLYGCGFIAYCIVFHVMRWRRDYAENDVANAFPDKSPEERAQIVRQCYRNLADTIVEAFWGFGASAAQLKERVRFADPELIQRAIDRRQTILLLAAHHGNWEWLLLAAGAHFPIPIDVVYQPQRLASLDEFLRDVRCRFGGKLIPRKEFVYELLSHAGEPRAYALIADQTPHKQDPKHWTRFLRQDTAFFVGGGKIAKFLEAPVYFVSMKRERRGYYEVRLDVIAEPPYEEIDDAVVVERYARCLERAIVDSPADWLWLQKKWKYKKPSPGDEKKPYTEGVPARVRT
jgi:KDO2-lipid IV(A) lauroyltransferase